MWVLIDNEQKVIWKRSVAVHPTHITTAVKKMPHLPSETQVAIEPTCGWRWVNPLLEELGFTVYVANPRKVQLIAKSSKKNDVNDAHTLAKLLAAGLLPLSHPISEGSFELRALIRERAHVVKIRTSIKNRLHGTATTRGLHTIPGGNPLSKGAREYIETEGHTIYRELLELSDLLGKRIERYDKFLKEKLKEFPVAQLLMTMPGVGMLTALTIVGEVDDFSRFPTANHLASFAGLVPKQRSSGGKERFGSLTNEGSRYLRTAMVEAAMGVKEKNAPELITWKENTKADKKKARVALARKMLTILWSMVKYDSPYDPARIPTTTCDTKESMTSSVC